MCCSFKFQGNLKLMAGKAKSAYKCGLGLLQLAVSLLPHEWDTSLLLGYPWHLFRQYPFIHLGGERHCESKALILSLKATTH